MLVLLLVYVNGRVFLHEVAGLFDLFVEFFAGVVFRLIGAGFNVVEFGAGGGGDH